MLLNAVLDLQRFGQPSLRDAASGVQTQNSSPKIPKSQNSLPALGFNHDVHLIQLAMGKKSKTTEAAVPTLSGFLLAQVDSKDAALDDIFANSVRLCELHVPQLSL